MPIAGFSFMKINAEKHKQPSGNINIKNNVSITKIEKENFPFGKSKDECLKFTFEFTTEYTPDVATLFFQGIVLFIGDAKEIKKILDEWTKEKKIDPEITTQIINTALTKCNIQAILISQELGLPSPIPLPKIEPKPNVDKSYIG